MKNLSLSAFLAVFAISPAFSQSNVTIYGMLDMATVYQTNADPQGNSRKSLQQGGQGFQSGNRLGFKGSEDLGGGLSAGFLLEQGFVPDTGGLDQQGQVWGRSSYVYIKSTLGTVSLGRQYNTADTTAYYVDALGVGAAGPTAWYTYLTGLRFNNAITYANTWGPVSVLAQHAFGELSSTEAMSSNGLGLKYTIPGLTIVGGVQQSNDNLERKARLYQLGAKWTTGALTLHGDYLNSRRDAAFDSSRGGTDTASITNMTTAATPTNVAAISSVFASARKDDVFFVAATYEVSPQIALVSQYIHGRTTAQGFNGTRSTLWAMASYRFSKRTDVYVASAFDRAGGSWSGLFGNSTTNYTAGSGATLNGHDSQNSFYLGLRHQF